MTACGFCYLIDLRFFPSITSLMLATHDRSRRDWIAGLAGISLSAAVAHASGSELPRRAKSPALVAYFSRSGNTRVVAGLIQRAFDADLFEIKPATPYPEEYLATVKWSWMANRNIEALDKLIDANAIFVHMGANMDKAQELEVIKSGRIEYKQADIQEISARTIGDTVIVLSRIQLFALVGGNEARNPFTVTETYVKRSGNWQLAALAFTRRMTPQ